ncbi:MAG: DegT/DnrJ/EryC1/StrS family aminotransferase [Actinobacteria bacterium]|nr:DegT/DnrJ/EryC1/StrS family aminotransferase [Actinomycetota bacterium]
MKKNFKIPYSDVGTRYDLDEVDAMIQAIKSETMTQGSFLKEFEDKFAEYNNIKYAFGVSSCTGALEIATQIADIGPNDEVITTPATFVATAIPVIRSGAKVVFSDIDARTFNMTAESIEEKITTRTKAIYVVHLNGLPVDMDPVMELAEKYNLSILEDVAQSPGAEYKGRKVGSIGDYGCFSFHSHKNITTLGEGGMITTNDDDTAEKIYLLRHAGMKKNAIELLPFYYDIVKVGDKIPYHFCLSEVQAAAGIQQLKKLDDLNKERIMRAHKMNEQLDGVDGITVPYEPNYATHVFYLWWMLFDGSEFGATRDDLIEVLQNKFGIDVRFYLPIYKFSIFKDLGYGKIECPNAEKVFKQMIFPPFGPRLSDTDVDYIINSIKEAVEILKR